MKSFFLLVLFSFFYIKPFAQQIKYEKQNDSSYPTFKFSGILKNKYEYAPEHNTSRFDVRNSRLGLKGKIFPKVNYVAKLELSDEGKFKVLDLYGAINPLKNLTLKFGQFGLPIFNSYITNPGTMLFANRAFVGKYFTGSRDIGLMGIYTIPTNSIPMKLELGLFNGNSSNNPVWSEKLSYSGRLTVGDKVGFRSSLKFFDKYQLTKNKNHYRYFIYGADVRYGQENWKIEAEFLTKKDYNKSYNRYAAYLQGAYAYRLNSNNIITSIIPAVRYDIIDEDNNKIDFDVTRFTTGLGFGLGKKLFHSIIRVDYEWYQVKKNLDIFNETKEKDANKFTLELVYIF